MSFSLQEFPIWTVWLSSILKLSSHKASNLTYGLKIAMDSVLTILYLQVINSRKTMPFNICNNLELLYVCLRNFKLISTVFKALFKAWLWICNIIKWLKYTHAPEKTGDRTRRLGISLYWIQREYICVALIAYVYIYYYNKSWNVRPEINLNWIDCQIAKALDWIFWLNDLNRVDFWLCQSIDLCTFWIQYAKRKYTM